MNLISTLNEEITYKGLDTFEKIRYIYLRTCEIFSFDSRWYYAGILEDELLKNIVLNRPINLENITDYDVICHNYSKSIISVLLKKLVGVETEIIGKSYHSFVRLTLDDTMWDLDATLSDFSRFKMQNLTSGFVPVGRVFDFYGLLEEIDRNLGYVPKELPYLDDSSSLDEAIDEFNRLIKHSKCKSNTCKQHQCI